ncbi:multidrug efflux system outer membrane protein [Sphingomonas zeicaulis]|uniref:efflux transporter outer membrane subunit n=1 Tax=Sphingomonas zeicaulis TaxID=1632740 RepID=UPI003D21DFA9
MHKLAAAAALLAATMLASCNMAPKHVRPDLPVANAYPEGVDKPAGPGAVRATELGWMDFFADPRLGRLIREALANNRDLAVSIAQIEEARGQYRIQRADQLPTLDGTASYTKSRTPAAGIGIPGITGFTQEQYRAGVGVTSFELDFWGRVRNLNEAARSQFLATVEAERAFRLGLIRDVATTYFSIRESDERIALAEATVKSRQDGLRIAKRRLDAGVTSALDYRQSETLLTQAETELAALRLAQAQARNFMTVLVGGVLPTDLPEPLSLAQQTESPRLEAGLPSDLLTARPDIMAAEERLRAARANIGAARAAFFPTISLTGSFGFASNALDDLIGSDTKQWSYGPTIALPIFDWGRTKGNLSVAEARENIAIATYERTIQGAFQEVGDALAGRRYLAEQVSAQERATTAQRQLASLARTRYREGVADYLEVLDAERNLFSAEQALLQAKRTQAENLVALYVALGGGLVDGGGA